MNKKLAIFLVLISGLMLVGYTPRPYSDLAEYRRLPMNRRIERLQKAGEDLFLRRLYEDAIVVFEDILALDPSDMKAKLWINKSRARMLREQNEIEKQNLFKKYGKLIPREMIYQNWHWGPSVGHFEVRYSEPKPYVPPERKFHAKASDEEVKEQEKKAQASGLAQDYFELSMRYWSRKEKDKAIRAYLNAVQIDPEVLANDDELLLASASDDFHGLTQSGKATAEQFLTGGRIGMIQGDRRSAVKHLVKAATLDPKLRDEASSVIASFIASPGIEPMSIPADIFSFRQAYVHDKDSDKVYLRILGMPRNLNQIFPVDVTFDLSAVTRIEIQSPDLAFAYALPGIEGSARLWFVLPDKGPEAEYEIKVVLHVDRERSKWLDLSNFSIPAEQPDNWSFIIASEFNFGEGMPEGEYKKNVDGVQVAGYHLTRSDGKGPYLALENFKEPLPKPVDVWKLIEPEY
ncbi:MAG: hypothetical protein ACOYXC_13840 [Candidatus Rifleibacteriota bacterium]